MNHRREQGGQQAALRRESGNGGIRDRLRDEHERHGGAGDEVAGLRAWEAGQSPHGQ